LGHWFLLRLICALVFNSRRSIIGTLEIAGWIPGRKRIVAMARVALTSAQRFFPLSESTYGPAQKYRTVVCYFRLTDLDYEEGLQAASGEWNLTHFLEASLPEAHVFDIPSCFGVRVGCLAATTTAAVLLLGDLEAGVTQW
jgi:hypothetical protein